MMPANHGGLSGDEAARRLATEGRNTLPTVKGPSHLHELLAQMTHLFALMLWVAAALAVVATMPELGIAIVAVIILNGVLAFIQEVRAEHAAARLRSLLPRRATVVRDGKVMVIDADELVRGDLVRLHIGDRVSADLDVIDATSLSVDVSTLTGESVPAHPAPGERLFAGTYLVEGEASGTVVATGAHTRLAGIAALTQGRKSPRTPLAKELERLVRKTALIAASLGLLFFVAGVAVGLPVAEGFLFGIGVTVALVPEGLLPTITLSLAVAARRMAERHALVRQLDAVETLGATTFICTDKTGTLTQNQMSVVAVWCPAGRAVISGEGYDPTQAKIDIAPAAARDQLRELARVAARCSVGHAVMHEGRWVAQGDPMEAALDVLARRLGFDLASDAREAPLGARFPFDPHRRRMSVVAGDELLVKGAPDAVFPRCRDIGQAHAVIDELSARGLRILAVAARSTRGAQVDRGADADAVETDLELLGIVGLEDPPRATVPESIAACRRAGLRVAMITGDHAGTAVAIAREVGLSLPGSPRTSSSGPSPSSVQPSPWWRSRRSSPPLRSPDTPSVRMFRWGSSMLHPVPRSSRSSPARRQTPSPAAARPSPSGA
jgi:magnesium-transporting ATPase (P-type)